jgi:hypothetical protein
MSILGSVVLIIGGFYDGKFPFKKVRQRSPSDWWRRRISKCLRESQSAAEDNNVRDILNVMASITTAARPPGRYIRFSLNLTRFSF